MPENPGVYIAMKSAVSNVSKFKKRKELLSTCIHIFYKTSHQEVLPPTRAMDVDEMYKNV